MEQTLAARRRRFLPRGGGGIGSLARALVVLGQPLLLQAAAAGAMWPAAALPRAAAVHSSSRLCGAFLRGLRRPPLGPIPPPRASSAAFSAKAKRKTAQEAAAAAPLPDDPAQLKLLVQLREAEGRAKDLEVRVHALELAAAEAKLRTAESWLRERDAHVADLEREKARLEERARANERMPLVEYVAFRAMIKCLEYAKSPRRRREGPRAPRVAVWEEIFADDGFFLESVLENVDFGTEAKGRTDEEMIPQAAQTMDGLYRNLYSDVHYNCVDPPPFQLWGLVDRHKALFRVVATQFSMTYEELNRYEFEDALSPEVEWLLRPTEEDVFGGAAAAKGDDESEK